MANTIYFMRYKCFFNLIYKERESERVYQVRIRNGDAKKLHDNDGD